jgi:flagellar P-ring protein precursor FlgI
MKLRLWLVLLAILPAIHAAAQTRLKDITQVKGLRENVLVGYGLVVGLPGTGDTPRNSVFTRQSMRSMLDRFGVSVKDDDLRVRNVAAVLVTAAILGNQTSGSKVDVSVASLGDATSLKGGTLVMTPLIGADGNVYAVAQGQVVVPGFDSRGQNESVTQGTPTGARIDNGAVIEREPPTGAGPANILELDLINPDAKTTIQLVDAINRFSMEKYGLRIAREKSARTVQILKPNSVSQTRLLAQLGELRIQVDVRARVVIDPRSGTVVMNGAVKISNVAVTHGNLTVRVSETPIVSQPNAFSNGTTETTNLTNVDAREQGGNLAIVGGQDLGALVNGLNRIGVKPSGIIAILQAIKTAGALQAELIIQ